VGGEQAPVAVVEAAAVVKQLVEELFGGALMKTVPTREPRGWP